jgi:hypothetical protein
MDVAVVNLNSVHLYTDVVVYTLHVATSFQLVPARDYRLILNIC